MTTKRLPVLFLDDVVLLPGMIVPIPLDEATKAVIDAAQTSSDGRTARRAPGSTARTAATASRPPSNSSDACAAAPQAAVLRTGDRGAGSAAGSPGPARPCGFEAEPVETEPADDRVAELAEEYRRLVIAVLQPPRGVAGDRPGQRDRGRQRARRHRRLGALPVERTQAAAAGDARDGPSGSPLLTEWTRDLLAETEVTEKIGDDVRESVEKRNREFLLREQLKAIRKELG